MTILEFLDKWIRGRYGPSDVKAIARDLKLLEGVGTVPDSAPDYVKVAVEQIDLPHELPHGRMLTFREEQEKARREEERAAEADRLRQEHEKMLGGLPKKRATTPVPPVVKD